MNQGQGGAERDLNTSIDFSKRKQMQAQNTKKQNHQRYSSQPAVDSYIPDSNYQENDPMQMFMIMQQDQYENQRNYPANNTAQRKPNNIHSKFVN